MTIKEAEEILVMLRKFPEVRVFKAAGVHLEIQRTSKTPDVVPVEIPFSPDMPPDNVMLFASTPTFDDLTEKREPHAPPEGNE